MRPKLSYIYNLFLLYAFSCLCGIMYVIEFVLMCAVAPIPVLATHHA